MQPEAKLISLSKQKVVPMTWLLLQNASKMTSSAGQIYARARIYATAAAAIWPVSTLHRRMVMMVM